MRRQKPKKTETKAPETLRICMVPCSCGATFSVAEGFDQCGTTWNRFLICPQCGKRHDPKNRLFERPQLRFGFHEDCKLAEVSTFK